MKQLYKSTVFVFLVSLVMNLAAQEQRIVRVEGWDPAGTATIEELNNVLFDAIDNDSTARKTNPNVVYELVRGHYYPQGKTIKNYNYHLHLRAEEGSGPLPVLTPGKQPNGNYGAKYLQAYNDLTLEYLEINGFRPDDAVLNRMVEAQGKNSTFRVKGCNWDGDRGAFLAIFGDSMKIFVHDNVFGNTGHRKTSGGNGRPVDFRPTALYVDTIVFQNNSSYACTDRIIRNMNTVINYILFDHNTTVNNKGFHGALQLGKTREAIVTNNIFANTISLGHYDSRTQEQTQPEKHFSVITLDTIFPGAQITVRNNNIYSDQVLKDVWAKYDSVSEPWAITPTIELAIGSGNVAAAWFEEPLEFTTMCGTIDDYVDAWFTNPAATSFPEDWCVGGEGGYFTFEVDLSFGTSAVSYTAADGGYPLGDLNHYPSLKSQWITGSPAGIPQNQNLANGIKIYPNPFNDVTRIIIPLSQSGNVTVSIYDMTGKMVNRLVNDFHPAGLMEVQWDGTLSNGVKANNGLYFFRIESASGTRTGRILMAK